MLVDNINTDSIQRHRVLSVGNEVTPIIIIDNFCDDLRILTSYASKTHFEKPQQSAYPGLRLELPSEYIAAVQSKLEPVIRKVFGVPDDYFGVSYNQSFSLVCTEEKDLSVLQCIPHIDTRRPHYYALLHYLNTGHFGGTGFFRHRPTQYEKIYERRFQHYITAAKHFMAVNGPPITKYCCGSTDHFELIAEVEYKPNRLVIYPGNLLHTGMIKAERDVSSDPETGRLTANIFLDFDSLSAPQSNFSRPI